MNYRLNDGTSRCGSHLDASTYQGSTSDPCLYCGVTPASVADMAALETHHQVPVVARRYAEMIEQELRANNLKALVYVFRPAVNVEHLPEPVSLAKDVGHSPEFDESVKLVRRVRKLSRRPLVGHRAGLRANDLVALASAFWIEANGRGASA